MGKFKGNGGDVNENVIRCGEYYNAKGQKIRLSNLQSIILERLNLGPLTNIEAITELHITSLSARICELRSKGICIKSRMILTSTYYEYDCFIAQYSLCTDWG